MMTKGRGSFVLIAVVSLLQAVCSGAQETGDFELRQNIGVTWEPVKRLSLEARYRLSLNDNASRFNNSMFSIGGDYGLRKWLRAGGEYRFYTSELRDYHRFLVFARLSYELGRTDVSYRLQYQQSQEFFDDEYLQEHLPRRVFRNRLRLKYSYSKKMDWFAYAEAFTRLRRGSTDFYRMRYGLGTGYRYKKRHAFNAELFLDDEFGVRSPEDRIVAELSYSFRFGKLKKKKPG